MDLPEETLGRNFPNTPMLSAAVKVSGVLEEAKFNRTWRRVSTINLPRNPRWWPATWPPLVQAWEEVQVG